MLSEFMVAFCIMAVCVILHVTVLMSLAEILVKREKRERDPTLLPDIALLVAVFGIVLVLHLTETAIWACLYQWFSLFANFETALYFSLTSYTTIGFGDVVLPDKWRLLGGLEGFSGVLLCGLSTAFLFVIISAFLQNRRGSNV
jgi:hypothetical protein